MALLNFKYGLLANLPAYSADTEGTVLIATDERAAYVNIGGAQIRLGDFQTFANLTALKANVNPSTSALYFVEDINVLARYDGNDYVQINTDTGATSVEATGTGNVITGVSYDATTRKITFTKGATVASSEELSNLKTQVGAEADGTNEATGLVKDIRDLETLVGSDSVADQIDAAIDALAGSASQTAGTDGLALSVTTENGEVKSISGSIAANTYDSYGSASAVQGSTTETVASVNAKVEALGTASAKNVATVAIGTSGEATDALPTVDQVKNYVTSSVADLEGAMHFVGVITRNEGETDAAAIARVVSAPKPGDVVVMSDNAKEYIFVDPDPETDGDEVWREVGDEGLYVQKSTTIAGVDLNDSITKDELKVALDIDDIESAIGVETKAETSEGAGDGVTATGIYARIESLEGAVGSGGSVDSKITSAIEALDADITSSSTANAKGDKIDVEVKEVNGKITEVVVTGNYDATYDAIGSAATAKSDVIGASTDAKTADTVNGAKAFATDAVQTALTWGTF